MQVNGENINPVRIYTITNPIDGMVFYVGRTRLPLSRRLSANNYKSKNANCNPAFKQILLELDKKGVKPIIEDVDSTTIANQRMAEDYWIQQMSAWGFRLTNIRQVAALYYTQVKRGRFTAEEIAVIKMIQRHGDLDELSNMSGISRQMIVNYFGKISVPIEVKELIMGYYLKRAAEVSYLCQRFIIKSKKEATSNAK